MHTLVFYIFKHENVFVLTLNIDYYITKIDLTKTDLYADLFLCLIVCKFFITYSRFIIAEVQERQECQYGENCTFAYCQEEIDVWTQERKGALSRELLFDPLGTNERRALSVTRLLQLHMGMFMFLCEVTPHFYHFILNASLIPTFHFYYIV